MLVSLRIENLAIIEEVTIDFHPGFNVLTGETGVGKSMVVTALGLLHGGRTSGGLLRTGAKEGVVEALFSSPSGEEVVLKRVVGPGGRGRSYVNGQMVPTGKLAALASRLMDIYGQDQHFLLRDPRRHLEVLDEFAGIKGERHRYQGLFDEYRDLERGLEKLKAREREAQRRREFLRFQIGELEAARIDAKEEGELLHRRKLLKEGQRVLEALATLQSALSDEGGVLERLSRALRTVERISSLEGAFDRWAKALEEVELVLEEVAGEVERYASGFQHDPKALEEVEERLHQLQRLKDKYGVQDLVGLLKALDGLREELGELEHLAEEIPSLEKRLEGIGQELRSLAEELSHRRREAAGRLSEAVRRELQGLGMPEVSFRVAFRPPKEGIRVGDLYLGPQGGEEGEFLFSANPGEEPKPLASIASGGELSRTMLALKGVLAGAEGSTLVFDEIDAGIGGMAAEAVGERLRGLSRSHQVLCVTHLPQIASRAHHHLRVRKEVKGGRTVVRVEPVEGEERKREIARMFAGSRLTEATLRQAEEMLKGR